MNCETVVDKVTLSRFDPKLGFRSVLGVDNETVPTTDPTAIPEGKGSIFNALKDNGYRTIVLGASGIDIDRSPQKLNATQDPRHSMRLFGVDKCSLQDGADFKGHPLAHDEQTLMDATSVFHEWKNDPIPTFV